MSTPLFPSSNSAIDQFTLPLFVPANRAPTTNDILPAGTRWQDNSTSSHIIYETTGFNGTWLTGGEAYATTTAPGIVTLSSSIVGDAASLTLVPPVKLIKDYVDGIAIAGAPVATTTTSGIGKLVSDANAVARIASTPAQAYFVQPSNLTAVMSAPGPIGDVTPSTGAFTTLAFTTAAGSAGGNWLSGGTTINIGSDASNDAVNVGTAGTRVVTVGSQTATSSTVIDAGTGGLSVGTTGAKTVTIGNITGATAVNVNTGTGGMLVTTTGTGNFAVASANNAVIDAAGVVELNSSGGVINIGDDAVSQNINLGTAGTRLITIGNVTSSTEVNVEVGTNGFVLDGVTNSPYAIGTSTTTGTITIGGTAQSTGVITLGSSSATSTVKIQSGAGASTTTIGEGTAGANVTSINNGATGANSTVNILSGAASAGTHAVNIFTGAASGGTQTFNLFTSTNAGAINIGTGGTGVKTIAIGGTAANVITIGNTQTTGSIALGNALTSGTITLGGSAGTGIITIGQATNATGQTVSINSGASIAGTNIVNVLAGATPAASQTLNIMTGVGSAGTYAVNILTGNSTGTTQTVSVGTGSARTDITLGGTGANVIAIANTQTTGSFAVGNALTSGTITLGGTAGTADIVIGKSTSGQIVKIGGAVSTLTSGVDIANGAIASGTSTVNILNGNATGGTLVCNIFGSTAATTAGTVNIGTGAVAATSHTINIGNVLGALAVAAPQTNTLASGSGTALTLTTAAGSGLGLSITTSAATVDAIRVAVGGIKVPVTANSAGASPQTVNARFGQALFTDVIANGAYSTLTVTNSMVVSGSVIIAVPSCTTVNSALQIVEITPAGGGGSFAVRLYNAGSASTAANVKINFWVMS